MNSSVTRDHLAQPVTRLYLLGAFRLELAGELISLPTRKAESLLAYLALHPEPRGHRRERLAAMFWGDSSDADARRSLRVALTALRKALGGEPFTGDRDAIALDLAYPLWVDALTVEDLARRFLAGEDEALMATCTALYRGDLLTDYYDDWLTLPRERLRGRYQQALRALVERRRERGDYAAAAEAAHRLLQVDAADESAHQQLMFCYLALGDRMAALRQYQACVAALREELAVPPSAETEALRAWIEQSLQPQRPAAGRRGNVPLPLTSLVGRQEALADLQRLMSDPAGWPRLITLIGPGGNGKTRLAQETGHALADRFGEGVWWVDLAPLTDAAQVAPAVARVVGVTESANETAEEAVVNHLQGRQLLLILDNCEHLVAAAAALAVHLLSRCVGLRMLATSREPLRVPGEQVYLVAPLPTPPTGRDLSLDTLGRNPAVALFVSRAGEHQPGFRLTPENAQTIARICRRLDGIPLAIELAAAQVTALTAGQIAERLDDRFRLLRSAARTARPRQQTLQALMDWSYDLLTADEQTLFRRLAVFAGGWTLDAAQAVYCAASAQRADAPRAEETLDLLGRLVAKSLILVEETPEGARYSFLETILAYARQRLADPAEAAAAADAHLAYFLALAERAEPDLRGPAVLERLARLERELDNLRNALAWASAPGADAPRRLAGLRLAAALELFWYTRGNGREGRRWIDAMLSKAADDASRAVLARAQAVAGTMAWLLGDYATAAAHHEAALAGYRSVGDVRGAAWALGNLAVCASEQGNHEQGTALYVEAAELARAAGARWEEALILNNWSAALIDLNRTDEAIPLLEQSAALLLAIGNAWAASHPAINLAEIAIQRGEHERASRLLHDLATLAERLSVASLSAAVELQRGALHLSQGQPAAAAIHYRTSLGIYHELADRGKALQALEGLAMALAGLGADRQAARLLAAAVASRDRRGLASQQAGAAAIAHCLAGLRARLGDTVLAAVQVGGRQLTLEEAAAEALRWG